MRVLHVINSLGAGGAERSLAEMLPLLRRASIDCAIVCLSQKPYGVHDAVAQAGIDIHVVGTSKPRALHRIRQIIAKWRPDIVHTTIFEADVLGRVAAVGKPCKVVTSLVNTTYDAARIADADIDPRKLALAKAVNAWTARHLTDHFHAITKTVKDSSVTHLRILPELVTVIERGRSLDRLGEPSPERRRKARAALDIPQDAEVVLNVGRQEPQKDQSSLMEAMAKLAPSRPALMLLQAGRAGKATPSLSRALAEAGLAGRVRFLGHRDDVGDLLAAADVFAFPSVYEGLGGSVLEAMAMRVPAVVTEVPALVEVVEGGRGASVVPVKDPSELARAIEHLLDDPDEATRQADRAHQIFLDRFTLERSAARMVDMYRAVAAGRRP